MGAMGTEAWLVVMAPTQAERDAWCKALGRDNTRIHVIPTGAYECKRRIEQDNTREGHRARLYLEVDRWFAKYNKDTEAAYVMMNTYATPEKNNFYFVFQKDTRGGDFKSFGLSIGDRRGPDKNFNKINGLSGNPWGELLSCTFRAS